MTQKFKEGDRVKIINYGELYWFSKVHYKELSRAGKEVDLNLYHALLFGENAEEELTAEGDDEPNEFYKEDENGYYVDVLTKIIGSEGTIVECNKKQGIWSYAIHGIPEKHAWYSDDQLKLV